MLCLVTKDGLLDAGMRRSRWARSSLPVPALLMELAVETGTILRGMNAVMCHDEVYVAAAAMARALLGRSCWAAAGEFAAGPTRPLLQARSLQLDARFGVECAE